MLVARPLHQARSVTLVLVLTQTKMWAGLVIACDTCGKVASSTPSYVERTVVVPQWTIETRTFTYTKYRQETWQREVTVYERVPQTEKMTRSCTVRIPVWKEVTQECSVSVPVWKDVQQDYTVMVPHQEERQGMHKVCQMVPVKETRTIQQKCGRWETQQVELPRAPTCTSGAPTVCKKAWIPRAVRKKVEVTVYKPYFVEKPYCYSVTVCRSEQRTRTIRVCQWKMQRHTHAEKVFEYKTETRKQSWRVCRFVKEEKTKEVKCLTYVPQQKTETYYRTTYRCVAAKKMQNYTALVPYPVQRQVQAQVCHMVSKKVKIPCTGCGC